MTRSFSGGAATSGGGATSSGGPTSGRALSGQPRQPGQALSGQPRQPGQALSGQPRQPGQALSGRRGQAARNDGVILEAARDVFLADPKAPIAAVADRAGVGISALYRRYSGKEDLLRQLCHDGLRRFVVEAEAAVAEPDGWTAFTRFLARIVDADVHSLTVHLAGTFAPTPEMGRDANRANELTAELVDRAHATGRLRPDVTVTDVGLLLEMCAAVRVPDPERTSELRRRYLALLVDGLARRVDAPGLPGPAPRPGEFDWRWQRDTNPPRS